MQLAYCYLVSVYAKLTLYSLVCRLCWLAYNNILHFPLRRTSIMKLFYFSALQAFLAFGPVLKCTEACGPVMHFLVFMSIFGIWSIFEMHRGMWPGYLFSRFHESFWHFAHFGNTRKHVVRSYIFSFS